MCLIIYGQQHATLNLSLPYCTFPSPYLPSRSSPNKTLSLGIVEFKGVNKEVRGARY